MKLGVTKLALVVALGGMMAVAAVQAHADGDQPTIEGVWQVTRHGVICGTSTQVNSFPALMTFHKDGTIHSDAVGPGSTAAEGTAEHGLWEREPGKQNYSFRIVSYGWAPDTGAFEGSATISGNLTLATSASFSYDATIQFFDAGGNLLVTRCGHATGTRF